MQTTVLEGYRAALAAKVAELSQTLRIRRLIAIENAPEACDRGVLAAQREFAVVTLDRHSQLLREVKAALARIDDGSYGICESCEDAIKPRRLEAVPWARPYLVRAARMRTSASFAISSARRRARSERPPSADA